MSFGFSVGDFIAVGQLCWKVYKKCKDSPGSYRELSGEVSSLHSVMKETQELLSQQQLSSDQSSRLATIKAGCDTMLKDLDSLLVKYESLGTKSQRTFDRMGMATQDVNGMRIRLAANVGLLDAFNNASSHARLEGKLNLLIAEVRAGKREGSVISVQTFDTTARFERDTWDALHRDLEDIGISPAIIAEKQQFIIAWFQDAVAAGKLDEDAPSGDGSSGYHSERRLSTDEGSLMGESDGESDGSFKSIIDEETTIASESINPLAISQEEMPAELLGTEAKGALAEVPDSHGLRWRFPTDTVERSTTSATKIQIPRFKNRPSGDDDRSPDANAPIAEKTDRSKLSPTRSLPKLPDSNATQQPTQGKAASSKTNKYKAPPRLSVSYLIDKVRGSKLSHEEWLSYAISEPDAEKVRYELDQGADVNGLHYKGPETMLQFAVQKRILDIVELLLDSGADVNGLEKGDSLMTALHHGAKTDAFLIIHLLMVRGANVQAKNSKGETALHLAAVFYASMDEKGDHERILELLLTNGAEIDALNKFGQTPLMMACSVINDEPDPFLVRFLLSHGAQTNIVDNKGNTALFYAVKNDLIDIVKLLLNHGAEDFTVTRIGNTVNRSVNPALFHAVSRNVIDMVKLLLDHGAEINRVNGSGDTAVFHAVSHDFINMVNLLLDHGAEINTVNVKGVSPLSNAISRCQYSLVKLLLERGAIMEMSTKNGKTVLQSVAKKRDFGNTIQLLNQIAQNRCSNAPGKQTVSKDEERAVKAFSESQKGGIRETLDERLRNAKGVEGEKS